MSALPKNQAQAQQNTIGAQGFEQEFNAGENAKQREFQTAERVGGQSFTAEQNRLQEQGVTNRFDQELAMRDRQFDADQAAQDRRLAQQHQNTLAQMGYANTLNTANVPSNFAASVSSSTMDRVNAVLADPNLDAAAKKAAVDNIVNYANNTIAWAEKFYGIDLPSLTVPGATPQAGGTLPAGVNPMPPPDKQLPTTTGPYPTPTAAYGPGWVGTTPTVPAPVVPNPLEPQPYRPVWESTGA